MNDPTIKDLSLRLNRLTDDQRTLLHRQLGLSDPSSPPEPIGAGHERLTAFLVLREGHPVLPVSELRDFLSRRLPDFMVPSSFQPIDALPLTPNGKIDRRALASRRTGHTRWPPGPPAESPEPGRLSGLEATLLDIWRSALGNSEIGPNDDFFEAGGDSILAIQMIAQAARVGITVSLTEFFQTPTIAAMAARLGARKTLPPAKSPAISASRTGLVPLSPIQHWFFEQGLGEWDRWNQTRCLPLPVGIDTNLVSEAIHAVLKIHPALRHAYLKRPAGWTQRIRPQDAEIAVKVIDLGGAGEDERTEQLERTLEGLNRSVCLATGELFRSALVRNSGPGTDHLILTAHHLAVDGISWSILLDDVATACRQLQAGRSIQLQSPACDFSAWVERLYEYADSETVAAEAGFWSSFPWTQGGRLPTDLQGKGPNTEDSAELATRRLTSAETTVLLGSASSQHRAEMSEILLAALARAVTEWTGISSVVIGIEGHGREPFEGCPDCSRTVGWFTSFFPLLLKMPVRGETSDVINEVKRCLREVPQKGLGFGLLKYLTGTLPQRDAIEAVPRPEIVFNYLGNDRSETLASETPFTAGTLARYARAPEAPRASLLEINTWISGGRLEIAFGFSRNLHRRETVESLADAMTGFLLEAPGVTSSPDERGPSSRDFPDAGLDQDDLNTLFGRIQ